MSKMVKVTKENVLSIMQGVEHLKEINKNPKFKRRHRGNSILSLDMCVYCLQYEKKIRDFCYRNGIYFPISELDKYKTKITDSITFIIKSTKRSRAEYSEFEFSDKIFYDVPIVSNLFKRTDIESKDILEVIKKYLKDFDHVTDCEIIGFYNFDENSSIENLIKDYYKGIKADDIDNNNNNFDMIKSIKGVIFKKDESVTVLKYNESNNNYEYLLAKFISYIGISGDKKCFAHVIYQDAPAVSFNGLQNVEEKETADVVNLDRLFCKDVYFREVSLTQERLQDLIEKANTLKAEELKNRATLN